MTAAYEEPHYQGDQLDEEMLPHPAWFGALCADPDFSEHSEDILRDEFGRSA
jgi:hypothetical protein